MSKLPSWIVEQERLELLRRKRLQAAAELHYAKNFKLRDSFHTAPGWREYGMHFTLGEHPSHPRDQEVTRALQVFDPYLIPMGVYWVFRSPVNEGDEEVVFYRHVVGRYNPSPKIERPEGFQVEVPNWYEGLLPNQIILIWEGDKDPRSAQLPGTFKAWDWELYNKLLSCWIQDKEEARRRLKEREEAEILEYQKAQEEVAYIKRDLDRYVEKKLESASEVEMKNWALGGRLEKPAKKPFAFMRR